MGNHISVIVPVKDRENLVERCLDSIYNQQEPPSELIVVDNNSKDNTFRVVERWMQKNNSGGIRFKLLKEEKPGACAARQKGLEHAEGDWLIFFDSDDKMLPELLEQSIKIIENSPESDIVCWNCRIHMLNGSVRIPTFIPSNPLESHLIHSLLRPQGYMVRKSFLENAGGWKKNLRVWNDYELGLRLLLKKPKIMFSENILAEIYSQADSITGTDFSSKEGEWEKTLKELEEENVRTSHPEKERINRILNYRKAILAAQYFKEGNKEAARLLMTETLRGKSLIENIIFKFSYNYTRAGHRGAWRIVRFFI